MPGFGPYSLPGWTGHGGRGGLRREAGTAPARPGISADQDPRALTDAQDVGASWGPHGGLDAAKITRLPGGPDSFAVPDTFREYRAYNARIVVDGDTVYALAFTRERLATNAHLWTYSVTQDRWRELATSVRQHRDRLTSSWQAAGSSPGADSPIRRSPRRPCRSTTSPPRPGAQGPRTPTPASAPGRSFGLPDGRIVAIEAPAGAPDTPSAKRPHPSGRRSRPRCHGLAENATLADPQRVHRQ